MKSSKKFIFLFIFLLIFSLLLSCSSKLSPEEKQQKIRELQEQKAAAEDSDDVLDTDDSDNTEEPAEKESSIQELDPNGKHYAQFALNVHDWVFPEDSIDAVTRTIEIHEEYQIPVDI